MIVRMLTDLELPRIMHGVIGENREFPTGYAYFAELTHFSNGSVGMLIGNLIGWLW